MFRVNHIHLKAKDPNKTAQWYVDVFGAKVMGEGTPTVVGVVQPR